MIGSISGEELQSPGIRLSRAISTSREVLGQLSLVEGLFYGRKVPRRYCIAKDMYIAWLSRTQPSAQVPASTVIHIYSLGLGNVTAII